MPPLAAVVLPALVRAAMAVDGGEVIAALFVHPRGAYAGLSNVDLWDETRDARRYAGPWPVVTHPPCSRWCRLAKAVEGRWGYKVGDDGGCFRAALEAVQTWGGVLEHPAWSKAFPAFYVPRPPRGVWAHAPGAFPAGRAFVTEVSQSAYGHRARKRTWLYYVGANTPPDMDWRDEPGTMVVGHCSRRADGSIWRDNLRRMPKKEASATPPAFRDALLRLALWARAGVAA